MLSASRHAAFPDSLAFPATADPAALSSFPTFDPPSPSNVVISPSGTIHVLGYTPSEGEHGVPVTVRIHFQPDVADALFVRLVVGQKAIATKVRELPNFSYGRWQLDANIPANDSQFSHKVLLSVQALNDKNEVLDSVTFGEFSYWSSGMSSFCQYMHSSLAHMAPPPPASGSGSLKERSIASSLPPKIQIPSSLPEASNMRRRSATSRQRSKSPISPTTPLPAQHNLRLHRRMKSQGLIRTRNSVNDESTENMYAQTPILELLNPLSSMCADWSPAEIQAGRRLVRFSKVQDGCRLIVSCEPIRQDECCASDTVVSCIYREEIDDSDPEDPIKKKYYVTSVDVISLLERLTNSEFPVEEKNRIRRNLEGLHPKTVSKHKASFGDFFQRIMEFPDPKPRHIEKDLKVFNWMQLDQALQKILSKYSIYTATAPDSDEFTLIETSTAASPELNSLRVPLPSEGQVALPIPIPSKGKSPPDELPFISPSSGSDTFSSPSESPATTSPAASVYPPTATEGAELSQPTENTCAPWVADFKPSELGLDALTLLSQYDVDTSNSTAHNFSSEPTPYDYRFYDSFGFAAIGDDALGPVNEHFQV